MVGFIITISIVFLGYIVFKITKNKILKYVLPPTISLIYGVVLFFTVVGIGAIYFYILALVPILIVGIMSISNHNFSKKN